jgi:hypothetical protein
VKKFLGALAIAVLALMFAAPGEAEAARCWWNGYTWICKTHRPYVRHYRPYYRPYVYAPAYYYRPHYRPRVYACVWPYC